MQCQIILQIKFYYNFDNLIRMVVTEFKMNSKQFWKIKLDSSKL